MTGYSWIGAVTKIERIDGENVEVTITDDLGGDVVFKMSTSRYPSIGTTIRVEFVEVTEPEAS